MVQSPVTSTWALVQITVHPEATVTTEVTEDPAAEAAALAEIPMEDHPALVAQGVEEEEEEEAALPHHRQEVEMSVSQQTTTPEWEVPTIGTLTGKPPRTWCHGTADGKPTRYSGT